MTNFIFVRKAQGVQGKVDPPSLKSPTSALGIERPNHKYIKRQDLGNGKYKYIYEESKGKKAPNSKDNEMMVQEFRSAMSENKQWKRYVKYFSLPDYNNVAQALDQRGEDITPESFVNELENAKQHLGVKASEYLPIASSAREFKKMFAEAGDRPASYNKKIMGTKNQQEAK